MALSHLHFPPLISPTPQVQRISTQPFLSSNSYNPHAKSNPKAKVRAIMASTSASIMAAMPLTSATQKRIPSSDAFLKPLPVRPSRAVAKSFGKRFEARASLKEKAVTGLTAAALTASMVIPEAADAAVSPSLKNFLLSIVAGGVVLGVLVGAVIGVANFDPVKRS